MGKGYVFVGGIISARLVEAGSTFEENRMSPPLKTKRGLVWISMQIYYKVSPTEFSVTGFLGKVHRISNLKDMFNRSVGDLWSMRHLYLVLESLPIFSQGVCPQFA